MIGKRTRWVFLIPAVTATVAGIGWVSHSSPAPTGVAIVDTDTGPTGARIVKALQDSTAHEWTVVAAGAVRTTDYAAVITLPADLTTSIGSLATAQPHRAQVTVETHAKADSDLVNEAVHEVTRRIGAAGVDTVLGAIATARSSVTQLTFTTQVLNAGVQAAADGAGQFQAGADEMLGFLNTAKEGAGQMVTAIATLDSSVHAATAQANQLASALDTTGVTVGQVTRSAHALSTGIDQVLPLLHSLPENPQLIDVMAKLEGLREVSNQAETQLTGFGELTGSTVMPDTTLATLLRDAATQLGGAEIQLSQGAELAKAIPQLADQGAGQLLGAMDMLTAGITQLQQITNNLDTQAGKALDALPQRSGSQSSLIAEALSDPVEVIRK